MRKKYMTTSRMKMARSNLQWTVTGEKWIFTQSDFLTLSAGIK